MDFVESDIFHYPLKQVFKAMRDNFAIYLAGAPSVTTASTVEAEEIDSAHKRTVVEWVMGTFMPTLDGSLPSPDKNHWRMYSLWSGERMSCDWRLENTSMSSEIQVFGSFRFREEDGRTRFTVTAIFHLDEPETGASVEHYIVTNILNKNILINNALMQRLLEIAK